ncbi:dynamin family protein [Granulicella sibirica]|uniref:Dynamin family protein n=1 Tax=Granulicella sibirica TaxID=2479048 RepID=A0A4V1L518_9BACT|nr:dynamin family protein [Granulicella sibirica]RXH54214.1 Dynamin family protein [Granulicella sibirica]
MTKPLVFLSYSRKDIAEKNELATQLKVCGDSFELWVDDHLHHGEEWQPEILDHIDRSSMAILLITADFLNSKFILDVELPAIFKRRDAHQLTVLPIIAKSCAWQSVPWLRKLQVAVGEKKPVWAGDGPQILGQLTEIASRAAALAACQPPGEKSSSPTPSSGTIYYEPEAQRKEFLELLKRFSESIQSQSMERVFGRDTLHRWRRHEEQICDRLNREFTLAVIGPFKRGKSTLINGLLQQEVVTSDVAPETITINEIRFGPQLRIEAHLPGGGRLGLNPDQLKHENLAPLLARLPAEPTHLDLRVPIDWLRGFRIVDTPGTGDALERFEARIQEYLFHADAVLVVLSALDPLPESERAFLKLAVLPQDFGKMTFVVNMLDKLRDEQDVSSIMNNLNRRVAQLFPDATVLGVSAFDEFARLNNEPRPRPERAESLAARFVQLRAHLQESVLRDRELVQLDRAADGLAKLIQTVSRHADQLTRSMEMERTHLESAITVCEDPASPLHAELKEHSQRVHSFILDLAAEAQGWIDGFINRLEQSARSLATVSSSDLQRHFPFFLADGLRTALNRCLDAHRPLILSELAGAANCPLSLDGDHAATGPALRRPFDETSSVSHTAEPGVAVDDSLWERVDVSSLLFDLTQIQVFGITGSLLRQFESKSREREKSLLFQQRFLNAVPELRRSLRARMDEIYAGIADRVAQELEARQQERVDTSLDALRQGRLLTARDDTSWQRETLQSIPTLVAEAGGRLAALQDRLWPEAKDPAA